MFIDPDCREREIGSKLFAVVYSSILLILANVVLVRLTFFFYPA